MEHKSVQTGKEAYEKLKIDREQFLSRARHNALLTIPSLMPLEGHDKKSQLVEPYQGLGQAGVVHLSSRLAMALLPAGRPYLRMDAPPEIRMANNGDIPADVERGLATSEQLVQLEVEDKGWRPTTLQSLQQMLVAGNVCENMLDDNSIRLFRLDQYVCRRNYAGRVLEGVIMELLSVDALPPQVTLPDRHDRETVELYTWIRLNPEGLYEVDQWIDDKKQGPTLIFTPVTLPYNFLRWSSTPGEDYGRAKVTEHAATLRSLEVLYKSMNEMGNAAARNFIMVRPSALAAGVKNRITKASNGDVVLGDPESVHMFSFENAAGFQIVSAQIDRLVEEFARAFLLHSVGQRNAERVTATEIERDIRELEAALGGNFSTLNAEMMEVRTRWLIKSMVQDKKLPELVESMNQNILTGLEALSRERDVARVVQLGQIAAGFGEAGIDAFKLDKLLNRAAVGLGFPDVVRSAEEVAQIQAQRQQAAMAQAAAGPVAGQAVKALTEGGE